MSILILINSNYLVFILKCEDVRLYITDELLDEEIKELENTFASYIPDFFDAEEYKKMLKEFEDLKKEQDDLWKNKLLN